VSDGVAITPGVGTTVATDDCGGSQVQQIRIALGAEGRLETAMSEIAINCATLGDNVIVAAVVLQSVRLYGFFFQVAAAVNFKWKDGVAGTDFHPVQYGTGQGAGWFLPRDGRPWFTTTAANALVLNLSVAVQCSGRAYYAQGV
jgi:hypothetical protein